MESSTPRRIRILILDDNTIDRETCRRFLSRSSAVEYEFREHRYLEGAIDVTREFVPDCILLDYQLSDGTGIEFLEELQVLGGTRAFPVVMLTGTGNETVAVDVMKAGAQDYLMKHRLSAEVLRRSVETAIYKAETERLLDRQRTELERLFHEAKDANSRKDQFLAALSHELRTPLTPVLAAVSAIDAATASREELVEVFSTIRRNIELEARLIDDMLDLTRIARGKLEIDARPSNVHSLLQHAIETCDEEVKAKQMVLELDYQAVHTTVQADPARLQQVFWNLLKNAVKFTPPEGTITISTRNPKPSVLEVRFADTGIGIEAESQDRIFDAFEQGDLAITKRFGGLGLGLAISKALVEAHRGTITVESAGRGQGTTFTVELKVDSPSPQSVTAPGEKSSLETEALPHRTLTVLLVEDHIDSSELLSRIMRRNGYEVFTAHSITEGLRIFSAHHIDVIVSDIGLPDGTGLELIEKIKRIRPTPAIALSGFGMETDRKRSIEAGFIGHITKPVDWPRLEEALSNVARGKTKST